jgi:hypothetical protein
MYLATPVLGIYSKECKSAFSRDACTPKFIAALLTSYSTNE